MRLLKMRVGGFRRFEKKTTLLMSDRLVALVGPNEAGKSSLLEAIEECGTTGRLDKRFSTRQSTEALSLEALYELSDSDRDRIAHIRMGEQVKRAWLKRSAFSWSWVLEPEPERDRQPRLDAREAVRQVESDPSLVAENSSEEHPYSDELLQEAISALESTSDTLDDEERLAIGRLANAFEHLVVPEVDLPDEEEADEALSKAVDDQRESQSLRLSCARVLHALGVVETEPAPRRLVRDELSGLLPSFLMFSEAERNLEPVYDLTEVLDLEQHDRPRSLLNVASLAKLDLDQLLQSIQDDDPGTTHLLKNQANEELREVFQLEWTGSDVRLEIDTDGTLIRLLVRAEDGQDFTPIDMRSDGLRWFIALRAFLAQSDIVDPILLVDELETHLHYQAQADLVDVLMRQDLAPQVVYTTHSAGALPPDLGTGIRAVVPEEGHQRSSVDNAFWTAGPGFTALLFGLGASTLAFSIPRWLVIAEGPSESVLLPTLLRVGTGESELEYRVAPGLSVAAPSELKRLDNEGGRVVYLVDGDSGGADLTRLLVEAGIDSDRIVGLDAVAGGPAALEDFVRPDVYLQAVNAELEPFLASEELSTDDLEEFGWAKTVEAWCVARGVDPPSKVRVAQRVVEHHRQVQVEPPEDAAGSILRDGAAAWLVELHQKVVDRLAL
jgi:hypothetical protein